MKKILVVALIVSAFGVFTAQTFAQVTTQPATKPAEEKQSFLDFSRERFSEKQQAEKAAGESKLADAAGKWDFELNTGWKSKYVGSAGGLCWDGPVQQSELTIYLPKLKGVPGRFYVDFWHSLAYGEDLNEGGGNELDSTVGWDVEIWKGISLNTWVSYFDCPPIGTIPEGGDQLCFTSEVYKKFSWKRKPLFGNDETTSSITPFLQFQIPYGLKGYEDNSGFRTRPGFKTSWEFARDWSISQKVSLLFDDGACGAPPTTSFDYKVGLGWQINKWLSIEPINFRVVTPLTSGSGHEPQTIIGSGLTIKF